MFPDIEPASPVHREAISSPHPIDTLRADGSHAGASDKIDFTNAVWHRPTREIPVDQITSESTPADPARTCERPEAVRRGRTREDTVRPSRRPPSLAAAITRSGPEACEPALAAE